VGLVTNKFCRSAFHELKILEDHWLGPSSCEVRTPGFRIRVSESQIITFVAKSPCTKAIAAG
jgi:hypothetical protein